MYEKDKHVIYYALQMWKNYIETGSVTIGANDSINSPDLQNKIKTLSNAQRDYIDKLDKLAADVLTGKKVIIDKSNN